MTRQAPLEIEILELTNEFRRENGLQALVWHQGLTGVAKRHANMVADGLAHFSHDGAMERFESCGTKCTNVAENLARSEGFGRVDLPQAAVSGWRDSEGHRRNLLGPFDACGIGWAASDSGTIFVTQLLALLDADCHQQQLEQARRSQLREQVTNVACSTPAVCAAVGLVLCGPCAAIGGGVAGTALDMKYGIKAASIPRLLKDRVCGRLINRQLCERCGATEGELLIEPRAGTLLCSSCHPAPENSDVWCFLE
jgi:hypothetical protein